MKMKDKKLEIPVDTNNCYYKDILSDLKPEQIKRLQTCLSKTLDYLEQSKVFTDINQVDLNKIIMNDEISYFLKTKIAFLKKPKVLFCIDVDSEEHDYLKRFNKYLLKTYIYLSIEPGMVVRNDGNVTYMALSGKNYHGRLIPNSNGFLLLKKLSESEGKMLPHREIAKGLNKPRGHADVPSDSRRVTDTVGSVRAALNIQAGIPDDPFISGNGYGLKVKIAFN